MSCTSSKHKIRLGSSSHCAGFNETMLPPKKKRSFNPIFLAFLLVLSMLLIRNQTQSYKGTITYRLSEKQFYRSKYPAAREISAESNIQLMRHRLRQELLHSMQEIVPNRGNIIKGISIDPDLETYGLADESVRQICPPQSTKSDAPRECLSLITNAYFTSAGTALRTSSSTAYELSGGCCVETWKSHIGEWFEPDSRSSRHKIVLVLNSHNSTSYSHVLRVTIPKFLEYVWLVDAMPEIMVAADHSSTAKNVLLLLGLDPQRLIEMHDSKMQWKFARVLLFPSSVFQDPFNKRYRKRFVSPAADILKKAVVARGAHNVRDKKVMVLIERATRRDRAGRCLGDRCLNNFQELYAAMYKYFVWYELLVYKANDSLERAVDLFSSADVVVGVNGGGMQNLMFCRNGTIVVAIGADRSYEKLARSVGASYYLSRYNRLQVGVVGYKVNARHVVSDVIRAIEVRPK